MRAALLMSLVLLVACGGTPSTLTPKEPVVASVASTQSNSAQTDLTQTNSADASWHHQTPDKTVPVNSHYEYRSTCGKPYQPVIVRWQNDGSYSVQRGDAAAELGVLKPQAVTQLSALYAQLRELTLPLPRDLTRASICESFATDHAQKLFATPAAADGWRFKDNHGCSGFAEATALRDLESKIEALLPLSTVR